MRVFGGALLHRQRAAIDGLGTEALQGKQADLQHTMSARTVVPAACSGTHVAVLQLLLFDSRVEAARRQVQLRHSARPVRIDVCLDGGYRCRLRAVVCRRIARHHARVPQPPLSDEIAAELLSCTHNEAHSSGLTHEVEVGPVQLPHHHFLFLGGVQYGDTGARA